MSGNFGQGNQVFLLNLSCSKRSILKCFPSTLKLSQSSNSSSLKSVFVKLRFRVGLLWTGDLTVEIKLYVILNSSDVVWTESGANYHANEHHQTKRLMSKTKAVQVCSVNLCTFHSHPLQNNIAKWPRNRTRTVSRTAYFSYFPFRIERCHYIFSLSEVLEP